MIPAMIWDLRERVPPLDVPSLDVPSLDVPPLEGLAFGGTSRHCGTSPRFDFNHPRLEAASTGRPSTKTSNPNLHRGTDRFVQSYIGCILSKVEGAGLDQNSPSVLVLPHRRDPLSGSRRRPSGCPSISGRVILGAF